MKKQCTGFGGMISFETRDSETVRKLANRLEIITLAESLGGVESLLSVPSLMTHASVPPEMRSRLGISDRLVRLSVGIEDVGDIIDDLDRALNF
jgi:cystathionine beta-lyase/cystathionine gamma-synthase